jgi:hypothetical protein
MKYDLSGLTLREKQSIFVLMVRDLITYAYDMGYEITFGDAWARAGHKNNSNHYVRLAIDLNLFKNGSYLVKGGAHDLLHDYWDTLGGAPRIVNDMNHYSVVHEGRW